MPKDNIERAIAKGAGSDADADAFEGAVYEGYAPGGVAMLVEALTDNRNRTGSEVRHLFSHHAGGLGEPGSVAWNFDKKGVVLVDAERHHEDDLIVAIDAGAEDLARDENVWEIVTASTSRVCATRSPRPEPAARRAGSGCLDGARSGDWLRQALPEPRHFFGVGVEGLLNAICNLVARGAERHDS